MQEQIIKEEYSLQRNRNKCSQTKLEIVLPLLTSFLAGDSCSLVADESVNCNTREEEGMHEGRGIRKSEKFDRRRSERSHTFACAGHVFERNR